MLSSTFQITALLATQKTSTKAPAVGPSHTAAAEDQQLQEDLVGERKTLHLAKTLSTSQSHRASSWSEEQGDRMDAQKPEPRRSWQRTRGGHWSRRASSSTQRRLFPHYREGLRHVHSVQILQPPVQHPRTCGRATRSGCVRCPFSSQSN